MQSQSSGASSPLPLPQTPAIPPAHGQPGRPARGSRWKLYGIILLAAAGAGSYVMWQRQEAKRRSAAAVTEVVRRHTVAGGRLEKTIRLTGTTGAENFVSLVAPQMHGSRSGRGRSGSSGGSPSSIQSDAVQSNAGKSSAVSGPSATAVGGDGGTSLGRANAVSSSSRVSSGGSRSSSTSASASSGAKAADLGSTASMIPGGSGGSGGGGSDFSLILQKLVKPGSMVKKGDEIAEFDRQYMLLRLDDYRASVVQQDLDMKVLTANLEVSRKSRQQRTDAAKAAVDKAKLDLKTTPVRSEIDSVKLNLALEEAQANLNQILAQQEFADVSEVAAIRIEELDSERAKLELKRATMNADKMVSKASMEGLVVMQNFFSGTEMRQIQQGDQIYPGQFFMQVVDLRSMVVNATVNQADVDMLKIGAKAYIRFDAYPDLELPAHVYSIGAMTKVGGMRAQFVKEIPVKLKIDRLDPRVIPDLSVGVDVVAESDQQAAAIAPLESIFRDGPGDASKPFVFVQGPSGWQRREVELGLANSVHVVVRSGLRPGEIIAQNRPQVMKQ